MNKSQDFQKYLLSKSIGSVHSHKYFSSIVKNITPNILTDNDMPIEVFSKLLEDRIIFLSTEIDDYVCNIIKAQLLYLEQLDNQKDIKIYIDSPGGSVYSGLGLLDTIEYVKPRIIVTLGLTSTKRILELYKRPIEEKIMGKLRGQLFYLPQYVTLLPTYHPAAIIYNANLMDVTKKDFELLYKLYKGLKHV